VGWAGLSWDELHPRPEAPLTELGWAGLIVIVVVGWAGLSWAELHPRPEASLTELGWAGLIVIVTLGVWDPGALERLGMSGDLVGTIST